MILQCISSILGGMPWKWAPQDFQDNSDIVKVKSQKVQITLKCTGPMPGYYALKIWSSHYL